MELLLLILALLAAAAYWARRASAMHNEHAWRPPPLRNATLRYSERSFTTRTPFHLVARVDRGYELDGRIILVEFKTRTRSRVYASDVIELSAQRLALQGETGQTVSDTAFVLVEHGQPARRDALPVKLLTVDAMRALHERRAALLSGAALPAPPETQGLCRTCGHADRCRALT